jgi:hypothetical protein
MVMDPLLMFVFVGFADMSQIEQSALKTQNRPYPFTIYPYADAQSYSLIYLRSAQRGPNQNQAVGYIVNGYIVVGYMAIW